MTRHLEHRKIVSGCSFRSFVSLRVFGQQRQGSPSVQCGKAGTISPLHDIAVPHLIVTELYRDFEVSRRVAMVDSASRQTLTGRPYRSHAIPACDRCRTRKIRCDSDLPVQPCRFCRTRQDTCTYTQKNRAAGVALQAGNIEQHASR